MGNQSSQERASGNALANLQSRMTGLRRPFEFSDPMVCTLESRVTPGVFMRDADECELYLTVGARFFANPAQYEEARRNAERVLMHELYNDVLQKLRHIRTCVYGGDQRGALERILELEGSLTR